MNKKAEDFIAILLTCGQELTENDETKDIIHNSSKKNKACLVMHEEWRWNVAKGTASVGMKGRRMRSWKMVEWPNAINRYNNL